MQGCHPPSIGQHFNRPSVAEQRAALAMRSRVEAPVFTDSFRLMQNTRILSADSMEGRLTGTNGNLKARTFIVEQLRRTSAKPLGSNGSYLQSFDKSMLGYNIIGFIQGKTFPDSFLVISAHYDHLGIRNGKVFNGADDNASGVAVLLEAANYFSEHTPQHSMLFCFFDGEEQGLTGSRFMVNNLPQGLVASQIIMNINFDMLSRNYNGDELFACGTLHYPQLYFPLLPVVMQHNVALLFGHDGEAGSSRRDDWTLQSDHGAFHQKNIPFIYLGVEDHPDYHKESDEFSHIQPSFFYRAANLAMDVIATLDGNKAKEKRLH